MSNDQDVMTSEQYEQYEAERQRQQQEQQQAENKGAMVVRDQRRGGELQVMSQTAAVQFELQGAMTLARQFPRDEIGVQSLIKRACSRTELAIRSVYLYPRGGQVIKGPSVHLAREAARMWGNVRYGFYITHDEQNFRTVRGWAWDLQTNNRVEQEDTFKKVKYRKKDGWTEITDERDMRELTNKRGAIVERNCLLKILPAELVDECLKIVIPIRAKWDEEEEKKKAHTLNDPNAQMKVLIDCFQSVGVMADRLGAYLGHPIAECSPAELENLRDMYACLKDGEASWSDFAKHGATQPAEEAAPTTTNALAEKLAAKRKKRQEAADKRQKDKEVKQPAAAAQTAPSPPAEPSKDAPVPPAAEAAKQQTMFPPKTGERPPVEKAEPSNKKAPSSQLMSINSLLRAKGLIDDKAWQAEFWKQFGGKTKPEELTADEAKEAIMQLEELHNHE